MTSPDALERITAAERERDDALRIAERHRAEADKLRAEVEKLREQEFRPTKIKLAEDLHAARAELAELRQSAMDQLADLAAAQAETERLKAIAEPECVCAHVDVGVGMLKVDDERSCPRCWPDARDEYERAEHYRAELADAHKFIADVKVVVDRLWAAEDSTHDAELIGELHAAFAASRPRSTTQLADAHRALAEITAALRLRAGDLANDAARLLAYRRAVRVAASRPSSLADTEQAETCDTERVKIHACDDTHCEICPRAADTDGAET